MSMVVKNNIAAQMTLGELNKNVNKAGVLLGKIASGEKITGAKDDAAGFAISEKMREQIRSLMQDNQNVQNGSSLVRIAEGGIANIVEELRNLKELAINSANDHNTDRDRATIQKEFEQKMANINDIATMTNYNKIPLLDGSWYKKPITDKIYAISQKEPESIQSVDSVTDNNSINLDGIYVIPKGYSEIIQVAETAKNIEIRQEDPDTPLEGVYIVGPAGGGANIWFNNLNIRNYYDGSIVQFQGSDNHLTIVGENIISYYGTDLDYNAATINVGDGLTLEGTGSLTVNNTGFMTCSAVGINQGYYNPSTNIVINSGTYNFYVNDDGGAIGGSIQSAMGDIIINGGNITVHSKNGAGIGSTGFPNVELKFDYADSTVGNIIIGKDAVIRAHSVYGAGIGTGTSQSFVNSIQISKYADVESKSDYAEDIGRGLSGRLGSLGVTYFDEIEEPFPEYETKIVDWKWKPLVIHHGTKANQAVNIFINDMHTKSLKGTIPNDDDYERYYSLPQDERESYLALLDVAKYMSLDDAKVTTKDNANIAIRVIDGAIEYALNEATTMGAYLQRLDALDANVTTMGENVQASESTIRDADMAKEMTDYTKANVLVQSAQAMLAQANQNSSAVLSLLQ